MSAGEPPMEWYCGFGKKADGLRSVTYTDVLMKMGDGKVGPQMVQYDHYAGNPLEDDSAVTIINEANRIVKELTGFLPEQISQTRRSLFATYKGMNEAPFELELF